MTYNESEDAYYIQYGADTAPKKLGSPVVKTATIAFTANGTKTVTAESEVFAAGITAVNGVTSSYHEAYGHNHAAKAVCSFSGNVISVTLGYNSAETSLKWNSGTTVKIMYVI